MTKLAEHLREYGAAEIEDLDVVLEELTALVECLEVAARKNARFRVTLA